MRDVVERKRIEADVVETTVGTVEEAERLRFPGSPTVRVNGRDVEPEAAMMQDYGLG